MSFRSTILAVSMIAALAWSAAAQKPQASGNGPEGANASQVVRIKLPDYAGEIPKGPNMQVYESNCLLCHGARYITMQPTFTRSTWEKEVKKMVDAYGAKIADADQSKIVEYLVAVRGVAESKPGQSGH